jgi:hypothetical protein
MKLKLSRSILIIVALIIVLASLIHGIIADISIFHGLILHPLFFSVGLSLAAFSVEESSRD